MKTPFTYSKATKTFIIYKNATMPILWGTFLSENGVYSIVIKKRNGSAKIIAVLVISIYMKGMSILFSAVKLR